MPRHSRHHNSEERIGPVALIRQSWLNWLLLFVPVSAAMDSAAPSKALDFLKLRTRHHSAGRAYRRSDRAPG